MAERFHFLLHIDSTRRLRLNLNLLGEADRSLDDLPLLEKRMIEMLTFRLLQKEARQPECEWSAALQRLSMSAFCERGIAGTQRSAVGPRKAARGGDSGYG